MELKNIDVTVKIKDENGKEQVIPFKDIVDVKVSVNDTCGSTELEFSRYYSKIFKHDICALDVKSINLDVDDEPKEFNYGKMDFGDVIDMITK